MIESQKLILFLDFLQKHFPSNNILNVVKKNFVKEDKTIIKSSHPPLENIPIDCNGVTVKGSPFKSTSNVPPESRKIIEQNNFVNQSLHTIEQQLDRIEKIIIFPVSPKVEKPLISLLEKRKSLGLKTNSQKNIEKIEKMLSELKIDQLSTSNPSKTIFPISQQFSDSTSSYDSTDSNIKIQQEINALNNDFSNFSKKDFLTYDDSNYHSASTFFENVKIECFDSRYNKTKICTVLTKFEEQENLLITFISKIENPKSKQ